MGLRDIEATLPPGFRFYPSDEELVCHYLHKKIANEVLLKGTLVEIDLHVCEPWQLPEVAKLNTSEWYFFSYRDRKYATGFRTNRATICGYWKATGKDRMVFDPSSGQVAGMRKTLVFYRNRAPNGTKTGWIMHEFRLDTPHLPPKEDWVLCRVFHKGKSEERVKVIHECDQESSTTTTAIPPAVVPLVISAMSPSTMELSGHYLGCYNLPSLSLPTTEISHHVKNSSRDDPLDLQVSNYNFCHQISNERSGHPSNVEVHGRSGNDSGDEGEFGFLWDLTFDQNNGGVEAGNDGIPGAVEMMRFDDSNNMILL